MLRKCKECELEAHNEEELELFVFNKQSKYNRELRCKECRDRTTKEWSQGNIDQRKEHKKKWQDKNNKYHREYNLQRNYGLSITEWDAMYVAQDGRCTICKKSIDADKMHTDHNHDTGEVRGLLCSKCNMLLGLADDSTTTLQAAITYLEERGTYDRTRT